MTGLVWRLFRHNWRVQLALTALFVMTVALLAVYGAYIERQVTLMTLSFADSLPRDIIVVQAQGLRQGPARLRPNRGRSPDPVVYVGAWRRETADSNLGRVPVAVITENIDFAISLNPNEVAITSSFGREHQLGVGDTLLLSENGTNKRFTVAKIHDLPLFGSRIVRVDSGENIADRFVYRWQYGVLREALNELVIAYPWDLLTHAGAFMSNAREIVAAAHAPSRRARTEIVIFLGISFLTVTFFSFLTKRKVLAITKTLGLRSWELLALITGLGVLPPLVGSVFGCALAFGILQWLNAAGHQLPISGHMLFATAISIWPATVLGLAIPSRLAQVATVNQLLHERSIPLQTVSIDALSRRQPGLDRFIAAGVKFVKLQVDYGHFNGIIFRRLGERVKQGEILAVEERWWGLQVVEYTAPASGEIVYFQEELGLIGVASQS